MLALLIRHHLTDLIVKLGYHGAKRLINPTSWPITTAQIVLMSIRFCRR